LDRESSKLRADFDRIKKEKERVDEEIIEVKRRSSEEIKIIREQQLGGATDKNNQLIS
jgi:hypothetical protein